MTMTSHQETGDKLSNPIYDSIEEDIEKLEKMICGCDANFSSVTKETWRDAVSPSSSISSISSNDDDDDDDNDFSDFISLNSSDTDSYKYKYYNKNCDKSSASADEPLNDSCVSVQEINMQIGVAEEMVLTPNGRQRNRHLFGNLETIHEGKFLHTPPKSSNSENNSEGTNVLKSTTTTTFLDRLVRE